MASCFKKPWRIQCHYARKYDGWEQNATHTLTHSVCFGVGLFTHTCVVLCFQVQVVQLVNVADVHLLFVQLGLVEVLTGAVGGARVI